MDITQQGVLALNQQQFTKTAACFPEHIKAYCARGFYLLAQGDLVNGFAEYEWRAWQDSNLLPSA